jgi:hypothetical protein
MLLGIIFPQPPEPSLAPNRQFLALVLGDLSPNMGYDTIASSGSTLPPGFLDDLINRFENEPEGLKNVFEQLFKDLQGKCDEDFSIRTIPGILEGSRVAGIPQELGPSTCLSSNVESQGKSRKWASSGSEQYLWPVFPHQCYS